MRVDDQPPNFRQDPTQDYFKERAICKNKYPNVNAFKAISVKCISHNSKILQTSEYIYLLFSYSFNSRQINI
jgi:hypothetical protein